MVDALEALLDVVSDDAARVVAAAKRLSELPDTNASLRRLLENERRLVNRHGILYALTWHALPSDWELMIHLVADESEHPKVRGQAAEALSYAFYQHEPDSAPFEAAVRALVEATRSLEPEVRYCAANALGANTNEAVTIKLSPGNQISVVVSGNGQTYAISGFNTKGTANAAGKSFSYTSNGGLVAGAPGAPPGVVLLAEPLWFVAGATTTTLTPFWVRRASTTASIPGAATPSSLVNKKDMPAVERGGGQKLHFNVARSARQSYHASASFGSNENTTASCCTSCTRSRLRAMPSRVAPTRSATR